MHRRHHCRCCGCFFCYIYSDFRAVIPELGATDAQRVCVDCNNMPQVRSQFEVPAARAPTRSIRGGVCEQLRR